VTTSTTTASLGRPDPAAQEEDSAREVLVGVEGSEVGLGAVRWAAHEAARRNAPLRIVHAAPYLGHRRSSSGAPPPEMHRARRIIAQAYTVARHTEADLRTATEVVPGDPTATLLRAAAAGQLVVLGSSTTGAPDELVLASVALRVAARSPQPVVVVPRRPLDPADHPTAAVLGVGDREDDEAVATFAAEAAERSGDAGLTILQTRSPRRAVADSWVDDLAEWQRRYPRLSVTRSELPAARADRLLAATCPATLLVISAGTGGLLHRNLDGPHRYLMRHCTSPMAMIPPVHRPGGGSREEIVALG
jgi:nucleotide-binding universal stress UspA family protein